MKSPVDWFRLKSCLAFVAALLLSNAVYAHESRPILVEVEELTQAGELQDGTPAYRFQVFWKIPASVEARMLPSFVMPQSCQAQFEEINQKVRPMYAGKQIYYCDQPLSGQSVGIDFPVVNPSVSTLFRINLLNGEKHNHILKPGENTWQVPMAESPWQVAKDYTRLGIQHIWEGLDHLLFVACLVFIARRFKRIVITVTGFTIAHSITLALATLGWVKVPVPPVEAVIALSIVFLAHEIASKNTESWTYRYPVIVSSSFGLLHGFGFAAVLGDLGLPQTELGTALLFFNLGVEIGQLLFILALVVLFVILSKLNKYLLSSKAVSKNTFDHLQTPASYLIGTLASFWMIDRITGFWS